MTIRCPKCGGVIAGYPEVTSDFMGCRCPPEPKLNGWECPRCRKIHSPFVMECDCYPTLEITPYFQYQLKTAVKAGEDDKG